MYKLASFLLLFANLAVAQQPLFRVVDLDVGTTEHVQLPNGAGATVKPRATDLFLEQDGSEQRKLLRPVLQEASWKGELRMCLHEPFENLLLSNRASRTNGRELNAGGPNLITGGEGGIRTHYHLVESATYRFHVPRSSTDATPAIAA
jgi:hypothetical protein